MSAQWQKKWRRKSEKEKNQVVMVITVVLVVAYGAGVLQFSYDDKLKTTKLFKRKQDRMKKQFKKVESSPVNTFSLTKKIKTLKVQLEDAEKSKKNLSGSFVAIDDRAEMRELRLAISSLADAAGVSISQMVDAGIVSTGNQAPDAKSLEKVTNNPYGRPLLKVRARASYSGLLTLFKNLNTLKHKVVVIRYGVYVKEQRRGMSKDEMLKINHSQSQPLEAQFLLAL